MKGLLNKDKYSRFTINEVLQHQYFKNINMNNLLCEDTFSPLKTYTLENKYKLEAKIQEAISNNKKKTEYEDPLQKISLSPVNHTIPFEKIEELNYI